METSPKPVKPKRWIVSPRIPPSDSANLRDHSPLLRQLLFNRGIRDPQAAAAYVGGFTTQATDPLLIKDMPKAVAILHDAIQNGTKITIYGDYDADGITSSALLFEGLSKLGNTPRVYIPNRFDEGYGLNMEAIRQLAEEGTQLIITVDCGMRAEDEVALARQLGMQIIVTDHHMPGSEVPPADAIINTRQEGDFYPYKGLAGVGLAYKLLAAYLQTWPQPGLQAEDWLDLVAIGTVADMAELNGENRALVKQGLETIRRTQRQGVFSLCAVSSVQPNEVNAEHIGFRLAPRLNASGRMESAQAAFDLLTAPDLLTAGSLAQQLDSQNAERKDITAQIQKAALAAAQDDPDAWLVFVASPDFNEGVVGLAASKVTEAVYRPAIIGNDDGKRIKASCRSIAEFNIVEALDRCADLMEKHGGHAAAAGLTVSKANFEPLVARLKQIAMEELSGLDPMAKINIDYEVSLDRLLPEHIPQILEDVAALQPTGQSNPDALFASRGVTVKSARGVGDGQHLRLSLSAGRRSYEAIAFNQGHWLGQMPDKIDIAYSFGLNTYQGITTMQLNIKDIKASEAAEAY